MNDFKAALLSRMYNKLNPDQRKELETTLDLILHDYKIEKRCTELSVMQYDNTTVLKNFLGIKILEGKSENTIKQYQYILETMFAHLDMNIQDITTDDLRYFFAIFKQTRNTSQTSLNNMRNIYGVFFKWCVREKIISYNPIERINAFKEPKKQILPFSERELNLLLDACETLRDKALVEFLYSTGCRVSECAAITFKDVDFKNNIVTIRHGKGDKQRTAYISEKSMYLLEKYIDSRTDNNIALWVGKRGQLTKSGIEYIINSLGKKTGIDAHPHRFRHTLASNMVRRNAPIQVVQQILGHENLNTTMVYVKINDDEVENIHRKLVI